MSDPKLLDRVRHAARLKHFSQRTEQSYVRGIFQFVVFQGTRHRPR